MSSQLDLQLLKAEESALMRISSKLTEQLNRLKVEELALLSQIRKTTDAQEGLFSSDEKDDGDKTGPTTSKAKSDFNEPLDLRPPALGSTGGEEEEEEEEELGGDCTTQDQLTAFIKQLEKS